MGDGLLGCGGLRGDDCGEGRGFVCNRRGVGFGGGGGRLAWSGAEVEEKPDGQGDEETREGNPEEGHARAVGLFKVV